MIATYADESPAVLAYDNVIYIGCLSNDAFLSDHLSDLCATLKIQTFKCHESVRISRRGQYVFALNYSNTAQTLELAQASTYVVGNATVPAFGVSVCLCE